MAHDNKRQYVSDEDRRDFLKALGIGGAVAAGSATINDLQGVVSGGTATDLALIGRAIRADLAGSLDAELLASQQSALVESTRALPTVVERGVPETSPNDEFASVAQAGWPVYEHLKEIGFFESTTQHLPELTPTYLESSVEAFVSSATLTSPLTDVAIGGEAGVDLLATVVANAGELRDYHWVATDKLPRDQIEFGEFVPPMTMGATGGALLWLNDLDSHLWQDQVLLTDDIVADAVWHGRSMAAGFHLMSDGARRIAEDSGTLSEGELAALLSTGFAVQAIAQGLLVQDVYWITEEMRAPKRADIAAAPYEG